MIEDSLTLSTASSLLQRKADYEMVTVFNPSTTGISAFVNLRGGTPASGDIEILSGGAPLVLFLTKDDNLPGVAIASASATPTVRLLRQSFPDEETFYAALSATATVLSTLGATLWRAVSATAIQPVGAFVQVRGDTFRPKTTGQPLALRNDADALVFNAATGANGNVDVIAAGTGQIAMAEAAGTDAVIVRPADIRFVRNNTTVMEVTDALFPIRVSTTPLSLTSGGFTDERHRLNTTAHTFRMVGNGSSNGVTIVEEFPISDGATISAGQFVGIEAGTNRIRVMSAGDFPLGPCVSGGTGDTAGTVKGTVITRGLTFGSCVTDNAGATQGQYAIAGTTDAFEVESKATIEGSAGLIVDTTASAAPIVARWFGAH